MLTLSVWAQEDTSGTDQKQIKTIFSKQVSSSGFGTFDMNLTSINNRFALLLGGHGGLIFNKKIILGFGGYGITTPAKFDGIDPAQPLEISGGYGGIMTGYIFSPLEVFHVSVPLFVGIGGLNVDEADFIFDPDSPFVDRTVENTMFVIIEPGIQLEVNLTRWFRIGMGLSYRMTEGVDLPRNQLTDKDVTGLSGNLSFKFGGF